MKIDIKNDIWGYLKLTNKPIVLYGMGNGAEKILNRFDVLGIKCRGVFASDEFVRDKTFRGFKIKKYSEIKQEFGEVIVIVAFGTFLDNVIENIKSIANEQELYAPDVPVYGDTVFDYEFFKSNEKRIRAVYNRLADEQSKKVMLNTVKYKLTGRIEYLFDCETEPYEADKILNLGNGERYLDLGAYNGDTVVSFLKTVKDYESIVALEPDIKNYKKLINNVGNAKNIKCINSAVGEKKGTELFSMKKGRNSHLGEGTEITVETVDSLSEKNPFTYIKMDVEGNELATISGGENTIKRNKPKMSVSAYHKSEDLFLLPEKVLELNNDYKIYLRHFKYIPAWDINYYFV